MFSKLGWWFVFFVNIFGFSGCLCLMFFVFGVILCFKSVFFLVCLRGSIFHDVLSYERASVTRK